MNNIDKHTYHLEPYKGRSTRHQCPQCGDKSSFAYYIDENNSILDKSVGRCNHESSCGYHLTPREFFQNKNMYKNTISNLSRMAISAAQIKHHDFLPIDYVTKSLSYASDFVFFLCGLFDRYTLDSPSIENIMQNYFLGSTKTGDVIFWQIDENGKCRTGKIVKYDKLTGHRSHEEGGVNWVHSQLKKNGKLSGFELSQCLFGLHLLKKYSDKPIAVVESEKSACICSAIDNRFVWMATGGKSQLTDERLKPIKNKRIILHPDFDGIKEWSEKAEELNRIGYNIKVSGFVYNNCNSYERDHGGDIADIMIRRIIEADTAPTAHENMNTNKVINNQLSETEKAVQKLENENPLLSTLIHEFDLIPLEEAV
jgi:hypothetical protein